MSHHVEHLSTPEFNMLTPQLVDIYLQAMNYPDTLRSRSITAWHQDSRNPGFSSVFAVSNLTPHSPCLAGVAFGFYGYPEHWWYQEIAHEISQQYPDPSDSPIRLLDNFFQISEVQVHPNFQRQGIGKSLVAALLKDVVTPVALLSTPEVPREDNNAFGLYRHLGFTDVLRNFRFTGDERPFAILSCQLPLADQHSHHNTCHGIVRK